MATASLKGELQDVIRNGMTPVVYQSAVEDKSDSFIVILSEAERSRRILQPKGIEMKQQKTYFVYILTNWNHKVMYIGVTNDLRKRIYQHKNKLIDGFTKKYNVNKLVHYEATEDIRSAIAREKQLKGWTRKKKNNLIITINPEWKDLGARLI